jgi:two-component sensor histidine kinase
MIDRDHPSLSIARQCQLVSISRSGFYYQPSGESELNLMLMRMIDDQHMRTPYYGARQMARHLRREGYIVGRKRIRRLMQKMGLRVGWRDEIRRLARSVRWLQESCRGTLTVETGYERSRTCCDIDTTDLEPVLKATVKGEGIGALAFFPLTANGLLIGKFMTYYEGAHEFTDCEMELAVTIARQLGFSIERLRAEEGKQLLLKESAHRVKNSLATVQAIAAQTLRDATPASLEAFRARLRALGEAHEAPLREVVRRALKPFGDRFIIQGSEVNLPAQASLQLTMCLHGLATNAAKYGALSNGIGNVHVAWTLAGEGTLLTWLEVGGPLVTAPQRKGFGSLLIEQSFRGEQQSCFDYRLTGLICVLSLGELPKRSL